tara:strand:+ start:371 stop:529 length:159 start_codon:yes stop_codon:yes gene_type:complete
MKPVNFCMKDFEKFILDTIPLEHADYILGLMSIARDKEEQENKWRKVLENES